MTEPQPQLQTVQLTQVVLGMEPYILIRCEPDPESADGFDAKVSAGGGIGDQDEMAVLLLLIVESLTGVPTDLYTQQVDISRRAAGLSPLSSTQS